MVKDLLDQIEDYRAKAAISKTRFGKQVAKDGNFVFRLERGRLSKLTTLDRVKAFIDKQTKAVRK